MFAGAPRRRALHLIGACCWSGRRSLFFCCFVSLNFCAWDRVLRPTSRGSSSYTPHTNNPQGVGGASQTESDLPQVSFLLRRSANGSALERVPTGLQRCEGLFVVRRLRLKLGIKGAAVHCVVRASRAFRFECELGPRLSYLDTRGTMDVETGSSVSRRVYLKASLRNETATAANN